MKTIEEAAKEFALCAIMDYEAEKELNGEVDVEEFSIECFKAGVEFAQRWIPVEEELPTESMYVLFKSDYFGVSIFDVGFFLNGKFYTKNSKPTHWRLIELK